MGQKREKYAKKGESQQVNLSNGWSKQVGYGWHAGCDWIRIERGSTHGSVAQDATFNAPYISQKLAFFLIFLSLSLSKLCIKIF